jgi:DNA-binding transcriptional MerR regulator
VLRATTRTVATLAIAIVSGLVILLILSAIHLIPQLRNPFAQTTTVSSQPAILKSITQLSRYEAASGEFQVVVDITKREGILPSFLAGSQTLFIGQGDVIAYVNFGNLKGPAITTYPNKSVTIRLPKAQLEPAVLNVSQSYVFAEQQGLATRVGSFFSGNPNSQQQAYILAEQKIQTAAAASNLVKDAETNTRAMLDGMLNSLGFQHVTVTFDLEHALAPRLLAVTFWSISEAAEKSGLSQHTLRWYERIGLIGPIEKTPDGRRRYDAHDLEWLSLITKLRDTGMPVKDMQKYAELVRSGGGEAERIEVLQRHREEVRRAIRAQKECLKLLDFKIDLYSRNLCELQELRENA